MTRGTKRWAVMTMVGLTITTALAITLFSVSDARRSSDGAEADRTTSTTRERVTDERDVKPRECGERRGSERRESGERDRRRSSSTTTTTPTGQLLPSFVVGLPPTTFVKVDRAGRIVEAATNTGCRPTPGDTVFVSLPNGTVIAAPHLDLKAISWRGSFRETGVYYVQRPQRGCLLPTPCVTVER